MEAVRTGVPPLGSSGPELSDLCPSQKCVGADSGRWGDGVDGGVGAKCMCTDCVSAAAATVDRSKGEERRGADGHQVTQPPLCCHQIIESNEHGWGQKMVLRVFHQLS